MNIKERMRRDFDERRRSLILDNYLEVTFSDFKTLVISNLRHRYTGRRILLRCDYIAGIITQYTNGQLKHQQGYD